MKYMLLIYHDEQAWNRHTEDERQQIYFEYRQLIQELESGGKYQVGDQETCSVYIRGQPATPSRNGEERHEKN